MTLLFALSLFAADAAQLGGGAVGGGLTGLLTGGGAIVLLIRRHDAAMKDVVTGHNETVVALNAKHDAALAKKDEQFVDAVNDFKAAVREQRIEAQRNVERQFEHAESMVAALEHVHAGQRDLHAGQMAMQQVLSELSGRVDALDGSKTHAPLPPTPTPLPEKKPKRPPGGSGTLTRLPPEAG